MILLPFISRDVRLRIPAAVLFLCLCGTAGADQIILKNGDRVTGSVVKKEGGNLVFKTDLLGVVTVALDKVESVNADTPLHVDTKDGKTLEGPLALTNGAVEVKTAGATASFPVSDVTAIRNGDEQRAFERLEHPGWLDLWSGSGTLGLAGSSGNSKTMTFTTGVTVQRATRTDKTTIYFNSIKASALSSGKNADTAEAVRGGFGYDHNIGPRFFVNGFNDYEYDRFQDLDLRFVLGGGLGFHAVKTDRNRLDLIGGVDYNRSNYSTPATTKSAEAFFGDDYSRKLGKSALLTQSARGFADLTNTGTYRVNFDAGTSVKLTKWLTWNISLSDRYLNRPALGRKTNDIIYTTGLGFNFAR